ncbi:hypothetical protein BAR1_08215 [Profundibacter amoris]|uniref:Uncharacterized protein n=1 Tax=Profundibacter amoris TaxID=2171755 RepID=A0A347UGD9_9RHOB|nr:hypothetical protein BAR1_08215 [Profundibacter amoris]
MNIWQLLRMSRWARNPPSAKRVKLVLGVILICLVLFAIERWIGVPDWLQLEPQRRFRMPRP